MRQHMKKCPGRGEDKPAETRCIKTPVFSNKKIAADQELNQLIQARTVIENGHPWNMFQQDLSGNLVNNLLPAFDVRLLKTLKADILCVYEEGKKELYRSLGNLSCRLNLTMNLLKHDNKNIYCYLTLHFIDENWELGKKFLAFKKISVWGKTSNLFVAFRDVLLDWKISKNVCSLTAQNTEEDDQIIEDVKRWLAYKNALPFGGKLLRVGCFAHILDLLVEDGFEEAKDVFNKMMKCVFYVHSTRDRYDRFQFAVQHLKLEGKEVAIEDITKTWTFSQLLEKVSSLRDAFNLLMVIDSEFSLNPLFKEWDEANTICNCLKVIDEAVLWFSESRRLTMNLLFPQACNLYKTLCDWNKSSNPKVVFMSSKMKMKFDVYWRNNNLVLAIAIVLDPRFKFEIVERWYKKIYSEDPEKHCARVHDTLKEVYCVYAGGYDDSTSSAIVFGDASSSKTCDTGNMLDMLGMPCTCSHDADDDKSQKSELERYLEEPTYRLVKEFDILDWWRVNTLNFPTLAKLARDFLAIPMSAACSNPTFNADIMKIDLVSMDPDILEALICAKDWLQMPEKKKILKQGFTKTIVRAEE
ncbi:hypothetical protein Dsin_010238 [Dipteronia sinensis]|uniref:Zinc finger BED domain-containing protein RICESLEEPER 2-like n=1 Tax=Dipteronia sinensis TaxID=43782 RepID=A0AAE0AS55_9ROSI|nr:hypothetical protein Dsin_010238 [Dipteronia sinensis]